MATKIRQHEVAITPAALQAMEESGQEWDFFIGLHFEGVSSDDDYQNNEEARHRGGVIMNRYRTLKGKELLVITEPDASRTVLRLPEES
jgi:hypothetical protein